MGGPGGHEFSGEEGKVGKRVEFHSSTCVHGEPLPYHNIYIFYFISGQEVTREGSSEKVELGEGYLVGRVAILILSNSG